MAVPNAQVGTFIRQDIPPSFNGYEPVDGTWKPADQLKSQQHFNRRSQLFNVTFYGPGSRVGCQMFSFANAPRLQKSMVITQLDLSFDAAVTADATADLLTAKMPHGLKSGDKVQFFTNGTLPAGLSLGVDYYVIATGLTTTAFKVSTTSGGSAVNITDTGTGDHEVWNYARWLVDKADPGGFGGGGLIFEVELVNSPDLDLTQTTPFVP